MVAYQCGKNKKKIHHSSSLPSYELYQHIDFQEIICFETMNSCDLTLGAEPVGGYPLGVLNRLCGYIKKSTVEAKLLR